MKKRNTVTVTNDTDMRSAITLINANAVGMCNAKTAEELNICMVDTKDTLLSLYKYLSSKFTK